MTYAQGGPRSVVVQEFLRVLEAWFQDNRFSGVKMEVTDPSPDDISDIRDIEAIVNFRPELGNAAMLELLVCGGDGPIAIGADIESWNRLEQRSELPVRRPRHKAYTAIFRDPLRTLTPDIAIRICQAVSDGDIDMKVAILAGAIVGCWGTVPAVGNDVTWNGLGMGPKLAKSFGLLSLVRTLKVEFSPWPRH